MRRTPTLLLVAFVSLFSAGFALAVRSSRTSSAKKTVATAVVTNATPPAPIELRELLDPGPALRPSAKALALDGKRVRVRGFMAEMEEPIEGAFYLVPRPLKLDESGAGTGDLPLESILVAVPGAEGRALPHVAGALEGTGLLEVGNRADDKGRVSNFRLRLDSDRPAAFAARSTN